MIDISAIEITVLQNIGTLFIGSCILIGSLLIRERMKQKVVIKYGKYQKKNND